jgi:hypothetical protein
MAATCFYPKRNGDYVYDVTVAKDEAVRLSHRYRAHLDHAERIETGRLTPVQVEVTDAYGPTVSESMRALDASFDPWHPEHVPKHQRCFVRVSQVLVAYRLGGSRGFVL